LYYYQSWGDWVLDHVQVPRLNRLLRQGEFSAIPVRDILTQSFHLSTELQKRMAPTGAGLFLGVMLLLLTWAAYRFWFQKKWPGKFSLANILLATALLAGTLFPGALENRAGEVACANHFLTYYEEAGRSFADLLPAGSTVYWKGSGRHLAFLLYTDDVKWFLPQIHAGGGYVVGDSQQLLRMGLYNEELDRQWRQSADILVIWPTYLTKELRDFLDQPTFERVPFDMGKLAQCEDVLLVYRRTQ
jgi:hypothetical protein